MKIPDKLKVAGHTYKVIYPDKKLAKDGLVGRLHSDFKELQLCRYYKSSRKRAKSEIEESFVHELLHAVDRHYNNMSLSEKTVDRLSNGLYQVLKDNFKL